ncbi:MAG: tetratricopeptide repeat protein [Cyanobacteria bacterium SZAS LIN-5]|nr:tetratricopeptide repeat protein [Cyanobacteria bacterium SZAS LIN-5]RTL44029.1 MAG: tetratricopeptide repeat protein [Candidatus Melainabacteria bacterium]
MTETGFNEPGVEQHQPASKSGSKIWRVLIAVIVIGVAAVAVYYLTRPAETPYTRAAALIREGKAAAALPMLEQLAKEHPEDPEVNPLLAQVYLSTDRLAEGRTYLDTALRLNIKGPTLSPVVLSYANYYESKGDFDEAEKLFQSASSACPPEELSAGLGSLYAKWADLDLSKNQVEQAVAHLELAQKYSNKLQEPEKSLVPHRLSEAYRQLAASAELAKNDQSAIELLNKSLAVSDEPVARMALAAIYSRIEQPEKAIENYKSVVAADANNLEARHRLIDLLCQTKDYQGAQEALLDLTDKEKSVENYQLLAAVNLKLENYAGAVRAFEDACDLRPKPELLKQLEAVLVDWSNLLMKQKKFQEAASVKGHAERVAEQLGMLTKDDKVELSDKQDKSVRVDDPRVPPVALSSSRIWLAKGSLTPEGEIKIRNISGHAVADLALTAVFFDNTTRRQCGTVSLPVASPQSQPFPEDGSRSLYFSCPNIVKPEHQLAVIIFWRGHFLKEFPVAKQ